MSWKNEIITSRAEAEKFLTREIRAATGAPIENDGVKNNDVWAYTGQIVQDDAFCELLHLNILLSQSRVSGNTAYLSNIKVADELQVKKGFGARAVKAAVGVAHEYKVNELDIAQVSSQGASFWPRMGAITEYEPRGLDGAIDEVMQDNRGKLPVKSVEEARAIADIARTNPRRAWRTLSQSDIKMTDGKSFTAAVFRFGWDGENMFIPLDHAATRDILAPPCGGNPAAAQTIPPRAHCCPRR